MKQLPLFKMTTRRSSLAFIPLLLVLLVWGSCRKDFDFEASSGALEFSRDTVFLDTVFSNISSSTRALKVFNRTNTDINIPSIRLGEGENSGYRLNVDGLAGKEFTNIPLMANDSLFIFIEVTFALDPTPTNQFLYTDAIEFDSGPNLQEVQLVTLVQDAIFLFPQELDNGITETLVLGVNENGDEIHVEGFVLEEDELNFTNEKPYVIYGYAAVSDGATLTMEAGTRVFFHENSGILVDENASLRINGSLSSDPVALENEVIFEGDRLEPQLSNTPGQWAGIWFLAGSRNNEIDYLTIKNATIGLLVQGDNDLSSPSLSLRNSQVHNSANTNLFARTARIIAENVVLGNAGNNSFHGNLGGDYRFTHSTIANFSRNGFRNGTALQLSNTADNLGADLTRADFNNCIINGNTAFELLLLDNGSNSFNFSFTNCLLQFQDISNQFEGNPLYDFMDNTRYNGIILNGDAAFLNAQATDFRIGPESVARGNADPNLALEVPLDILGIDRTNLPDIGAYQIIQQN
ncbi:hypothetical protein [Spongiimicrobium salis]|uniref:hypothetical protein n=1 Tax=Spongiimicrobium salis TaxID=1667022 RepID=UPI00374CB6E6